MPGYPKSTHRGLTPIVALLMVSAIILVGVIAVQAHSESARRSHNLKSTVELNKTWYLTERSTDGMQTWIQLQNPGMSDARVTLRFHADGDTVDSLDTELKAGMSVSLNAEDYVGNQDISSVVESDQPIAASIAVYDPSGEPAYSASGSTRTRDSWYFREGASAGSLYQTWILLYNPNTEPTEVKVSFRSGNGVVGPLVYEIGARWIIPINMGDHISGFDVATVVESELPVVAVQRTNGELDPQDPKARVVAVAHAQIGKPYSRGGGGPDRFDCSGLTQYCYMVGAGMSLPHSSYAQSRCGAPVPREDLRPGDIVGFHGWGHVGIYIGNDDYIHAPQSGEFVRIDPLSARSDYCGAVRP